MITWQQGEIGTDVGNLPPVNLHRHDRQPALHAAPTAYDPDLLVGERHPFIHLPRARTGGTAYGHESRYDEERATRTPG